MYSLERHASQAEQKAVTALIELLLELPVSIRVYDGIDWACERTSDPSVLYDAVASTGFDVLGVYDAESGAVLGQFYLIYQDSGDAAEAVYDHTDNNFCHKVMAELYHRLGF